MMNNLSEADQAKIRDLRQAYVEATQSLRSQRNSKRFALRSELAKENPDLQTAAKLQTELSDLNAQLAQKRVEHIIEMKKINPNAGMGFMMGDGYGHDRGKGGGRGAGCGKRW
jgi:Spy/CpxP family protein refolding chaperone